VLHLGGISSYNAIVKTFDVPSYCTLKSSIPNLRDLACDVIISTDVSNNGTSLLRRI
jgi:NAD-dependent oxidoreductase involved in siderophore biosynthesis